MAGNLATVVRTMDEFAVNTGLSSSSTPRRYLWTDAFAVCNYLGLQKHTSDERYGHLALDLVNNVHNILGKHRDDDTSTRQGWISGLSDSEGELYPTSGGLRIGKKLPERKPSDPYDDDQEWDRDGQYYHYITKWMYALNCMTRSTGDSKFNALAAEMVKGTHDKFTYGTGKKRMYWKMSIDLSKPQVRSMGHHDPLDGYITYLQIQQTLTAQDKDSLSLVDQISDMADICKGKDWTTTDPLGLGGLLCDAYRVFSMMTTDESVAGGSELLDNILQACDRGLDAYIHNIHLRYSNQLQKPAEHRLAFRELGLSIGLQAIQKMQHILPNHPEIVKLCSHLPKSLERLQKYVPIVNEINNFWSNATNQKARSWKSHMDINMVMWATSLMPEGFLCI